MIRGPLRSSHFPYTTLFRAEVAQGVGLGGAEIARQVRGDAEAAQHRGDPAGSVIAQGAGRGAITLNDRGRSNLHTTDVRLQLYTICPRLLEITQNVGLAVPK